MGTLDSFNGLGKNRVLEWNIQEYAVQRGKETTTILKDIGACVRVCVRGIASHRIASYAL
jgi:hypothetical protein